MTSPMDDGVETAEEARQGEDVKGMTTVLRVSVIVVVLLFALLLVFFARGSGHARPAAGQGAPAANSTTS